MGQNTLAIDPLVGIIRFCLKCKLSAADQQSGMHEFLEFQKAADLSWSLSHYPEYTQQAWKVWNKVLGNVQQENVVCQSCTSVY